MNEAKREWAIKKPDHDVINYLTEHTGGSIRHKNIRAIDCQHALFDLYRDWEKYHASVAVPRELARQLARAIQDRADVSLVLASTKYPYKKYQREDFMSIGERTALAAFEAFAGKEASS